MFSVYNEWLALLNVLLQMPQDVTVESTFMVRYRVHGCLNVEENIVLFKLNKKH